MGEKKSRTFQPTWLEKTCCFAQAEFSLLIQAAEHGGITERNNCNKLHPHKRMIPAVATAES